LFALAVFFITELVLFLFLRPDLVSLFPREAEFPIAGRMERLPT
jgi:hypothetical protein